MRYWWTIWANALGVKAKEQDNNFSDRVATVRTLILLVYVMTNVVIIASNMRHW